MKQETKNDEVVISKLYSKTPTKEVEEEEKEFNPYANNYTAFPNIQNGEYAEKEDFGGEEGMGHQVFDLKGNRNARPERGLLPNSTTLVPRSI